MNQKDKGPNVSRETSWKSCDECANFVPVGEDAPESANPCSLGHAMTFVMPEGHPDYCAWGLTRPGCSDRVVGFVPWRPRASPRALLMEAGMEFGEPWEPARG